LVLQTERIVPLEGGVLPTPLRPCITLEICHR
jgi:hypothetical protein